jgi:hypothetical protein
MMVRTLGRVFSPSRGEWNLPIIGQELRPNRAAAMAIGARETQAA